MLIHYEVNEVVGLESDGPRGGIELVEVEPGRARHEQRRGPQRRRRGRAADALAAAGVVVLAHQLVQRAPLRIRLAAAAAHRAAPPHHPRAHRVRRVEAAPAHPQPRTTARPHAQPHVLL